MSNASPIETVDVTAQTETGFPDDEVMPLLKCVCGQKYASWDHIISIEPDLADPMPCCGAKLYWAPAWKVRRVLEAKA